MFKSNTQNRIFTLIAFALLLAVSCQRNDAKDENVSIDSLAENADIQTDSIFMQKAAFLAAEKSQWFSHIQNQQFYKDYSANLEKSWNIVTSKNLENIAKWNSEHPLVKNENLTLLYPFSGPDFLYANAFFPNAQNYIMIGLEKIGELPNFNDMDDVQLTEYLEKLHSSLRYANKAAYFTTKHMQEDFSSEHFNGVIHLISFYLSKTKHQIINIKPIQINHFGVVEEKGNYDYNDELINGINITVQDKSGSLKNVYYLSVDLSNSNVKNNIGLTSFLSKMGKKNVFIKSASYLLHSKDFSVIRDLILKQSETIIQDDTGVPFATLQAAGFNTHLFGNYSRTINVFKNYYQKDLAEAIDNERIDVLPFKLGYNSWKGKMVLMVAISGKKKIRKPITYKIQKKGVIYKVQIKTAWHKIPANDPMFSGLPQVEVYRSNNLYKYTIGSFSSYEACSDFIQKAQKKGFKDAFVVAFYKKNRISLPRAGKIANANR